MTGRDSLIDEIQSLTEQLAAAKAEIEKWKQRYNFSAEDYNKRRDQFEAALNAEIKRANCWKDDALKAQTALDKELAQNSAAQAEIERLKREAFEKEMSV